MEHSEAKRIFNYDPEDGVVTWKIKTGHRSYPGKVAGHKSRAGYIQIVANGEFITAHRLAFLLMTGSIPECVDHINGDPSDNRWANLRPATRQENTRNKKVNKNSSTGIKGVRWKKDAGKYVVSIMVSGRTLYFGLWDDLEAAELVAILAREKYHGEFANHG